MPDELLVKPASGNHAIEVMALAVEWGRPLGAEVISAIRAMWNDSKTLQDFLPKIEVLQGITVSIGTDGPTVGAAEVSGLQLSRTRDDGSPMWIVHIRPELLSCSCMEYDRWDTTKAKALEVLMPIIDLAVAGNYPLQAVGVQYQDAFRVTTASPMAATSRLFASDTSWLSSQIWTQEYPWHVHQGWFSAGLGGRLVQNVLNVDVTADEQGCLFRINGQHRMLTVNQTSSDTVSSIQSADVSVALDYLHMDNKRALSQLLSAKVCSQIGLNFVESK